LKKQVVRDCPETDYVVVLLTGTEAGSGKYFANPYTWITAKAMQNIYT
jgi:hypothetical protein